MNIPKHIAIIPDGNRRWAKKQNLPPIKGHEAGFKALRQLLKDNKNADTKVLSFYAFSTENFQRDETEVKGLFNLLEQVIDNFSKELKKENIKLLISGSRSNISASLLKKLDQAVELCRNGELILNICFNYGSQEEILSVTQRLAEQYKNGTISEITKEIFETELWTHPLPPVDLIIRTSGEYRISNYLLWQSAYAELYFTDTLWPDFSNKHFNDALETFHQRQRRWGK